MLHTAYNFTVKKKKATQYSTENATPRFILICDESRFQNDSVLCKKLPELALAGHFQEDRSRASGYHSICEEMENEENLYHQIFSHG